MIKWRWKRFNQRRKDQEKSQERNLELKQQNLQYIFSDNFRVNMDPKKIMSKEIKRNKNDCIMSIINLTKNLQIIQRYCKKCQFSNKKNMLEVVKTCMGSHLIPLLLIMINQNHWY
ncbi:unnamed protein product [Paramecium sonneborni]|uniref:Uncharacterized protein n=1 Tax=Paramecium sonneborni TaxID=65129 RepID=A0A8S1LRA8_9CILI|nr:unnamed protein product [Paramecium sonneborni]